MLDAQPATLTETGTVTIGPDGSIVLTGFQVKNGSCRETAVLATVWAIGELQRSLMGDLQRPGGGNSGIGD